jgi:predicted DNA binding CopG/RHH family protein
MAKRKGGYKPITRDKTLQVRVTASEYEGVKSKAFSKGWSIPKFLRSIIFLGGENNGNN